MIWVNWDDSKVLTLYRDSNVQLTFELAKSLDKHGVESLKSQWIILACRKQLRRSSIRMRARAKSLYPAYQPGTSVWSHWYVVYYTVKYEKTRDASTD